MPVTLLALLSCDGGAGDRPPPAPEPVPAPTPGPVPMPTPGSAPVPTTPPWDCSQTTVTRAWELGSFADQEITHLAPLPGGDVIVVGDMYGTMDFGDGVVAEAYLGDDIVIARIGSDGTPQWAEMATGGGMIPKGLAVGLDGTIALVGWFQSELVLARGEPNEVAVRDPIYTINGFVAVLEPSGAPRWVRAVSGTDLSMEELVGVAISPDGSLWVAGSFEHETATVSAGEPDAIVIADADSSTSTADVFLAHYDPNGALLGVVTLLGDGPQFSLAVAAGPKGAVDWAISGDPSLLTDGTGATYPAQGDLIIRLDGTGALVDQFALPTAQGAFALGYQGRDLVALLTTQTPATVSSWSDAASVELESRKGLFSGLVSWAGVDGIVSTEVLADLGNATIAQLDDRGSATGHTISRDYTFFPATTPVEIEASKLTPWDVARPGAVARDASGRWTCGVDVELTASPSSNNLVKAVALDDAGGLWLAGRYNEGTLAVESESGGPLAAELQAVAAEEYQGWLVRWQLWPGTAEVP